MVSHDEQLMTIRDGRVRISLNPFSSVIVLGTVVAIEDRFDIAVTNRVLRKVAERGITLANLAKLIRDLDACTS